ncbi:MAG: hypothetical protein ACI35S_10345 [Anaeroplasma sp.]
MKLFNLIIEIITAPFNVLIRSNAIPNPHKSVKPLLVFIISLFVTAVLIFLFYYEVFIKC